jgi:hypothetical protein
MISFEITQVIKKPIGQVFSFLSDFSNMIYWNYYIQSVTKISEADTGLNAIFEMKRPHDLNLYKITAFDPPNNITIELQPPGPMQQLVFVLSAKDQDTCVSYTWNVNLEKYKLLKYIPRSGLKRLILSITQKIILRKTKPAVEQNFKKLKDLLETGEVMLQDGRHIVWPLKETITEK